MNVITVPVTEVKSELEILVNAKGRKAAEKTMNDVLRFGTVNPICQEWLSKEILR